MSNKEISSCGNEDNTFLQQKHTVSIFSKLGAYFELLKWEKGWYLNVTGSGVRDEN